MLAILLCYAAGHQPQLWMLEIGKRYTAPCGFRKGIVGIVLRLSIYCFLLLAVALDPAGASHLVLAHNEPRLVKHETTMTTGVSLSCKVSLSRRVL